MKLEVIFHDRIGGYVNGQIAEVEDSPFIRAALRGGKADVINPPDWELDVPYNENKEEVIIKEEVTPVEKNTDNGQNGPPKKTGRPKKNIPYPRNNR